MELMQAGVDRTLILGSGVNLPIAALKQPRREPVNAVRGPSTRELRCNYSSERGAKVDEAMQQSSHPGTRYEAPVAFGR